MAEVIYVYGLVPETPETRFPAGIEDFAVSVLASGGFRALVSRLPESDYGADAVARNSADVSWLSPRAMAHDRVLTWAQEHGGVIPFPMFSLFTSDGALGASLRERANALRHAFERVRDADEFGVRVHRRDAVMLRSIDQLDPAIGALRGEADAASPGQRYLLDRKIAEQSKTAVRTAGQRIAREILERLTRHARQALSRPLVPDPERASEATMILNGAFLVDRGATTAFRAAVADCIRAWEDTGITLEFTGPWPPYNFVGSEPPAT